MGGVFYGVVRQQGDQLTHRAFVAVQGDAGSDIDLPADLLERRRCFERLQRFADGIGQGKIDQRHGAVVLLHAAQRRHGFGQGR